MKKGKGLLAILLALVTMVGMIPMNVRAGGEDVDVRFQHDLEFTRSAEGEIEINVRFIQEEGRVKFEDDVGGPVYIHFVTPPEDGQQDSIKYPDYEIRPYEYSYKYYGGWDWNTLWWDRLAETWNTTLAVEEGYTEVPTKHIRLQNWGKKTMKIGEETVKPDEYLDVFIKFPLGLPLGEHTIPFTFQGRSTIRNKVKCEARVNVTLRVYNQYTVTFDPDGGYWGGDPSNKDNITLKTDGNGKIDYSSIPILRHNDKKHVKWYYEKDGKGIRVDKDTVFSEDTVVKPAWDNIQNIAIDTSKLENLTVGSKVKLELSTPGYGTGKVTWNSSKPEVASIAGDILTVHRPGEFLLYVEKDESPGYTEAWDQLDIEIERLPQRIKIDTSEFIQYYNPDGSNVFPLQLKESGEGTGEVTWESSNSTIVIENGTARVTGSGFVVITAKKESDDVYEECYSNVMLWIGQETEAYIYPAGNGKTFVDGVEINSLNDLDSQNRKIVSRYEWDVIEGIRAVPNEGYHFQKWEIQDGEGVGGKGYFQYDGDYLGRETSEPLVDFVMGAYSSYQVPHIRAYFEAANQSSCKGRVSLVESVSENCGKAGTKAYYQCECGAAYEDEDCETPIENLETWKAENGGGYIPPKGNHAYGEPTEGANGTLECTCSVCGDKVTAEGLPDSATVTVTKIDIKSNPTKTTYNIGESLDLTGAKITVTLSNSSTEEIDITSGMVSGFDSTTAGDNTVTVTYEGQTTTFMVTVEEEEEEHQHTFSTAWSSDTTYHWYACTATGHTEDCLADTGAAKAAHGSWNDGECGTCGYACLHGGATTGTCSTCGKDLGSGEGTGTGNGTTGGTGTGNGAGSGSNGNTGSGSGTGGTGSTGSGSGSGSSGSTGGTGSGSGTGSSGGSGSGSGGSYMPSPVPPSSGNSGSAPVVNNSAAQVTTITTAPVTTPNTSVINSADSVQVSSSTNKITLSGDRINSIAKDLNDNSNTRENLEIKLNGATAKIDGDALSAIAAQAAGKDINFNININGNTISLGIQSNGKAISDFGGGKVTITMNNFKVEAGKNPVNYHVYFKPVSGAPVRMPTWIVNGILHFATGHFSDYEIVYDENLINGEAKKVYRMSFAGTGDHIFTASIKEKEAAEKAGWVCEGIAFEVLNDGNKVYRLFNKKSGKHLFTTTEKERDFCVANGWDFEGVALYADGEKEVFRVISPEGKHLLTANTKERNALVQSGWTNEGVAFLVH